MKSKTTRKTFVLGAEAERKLEDLARSRGVTVSEILREAVAKMIERAEEDSFDLDAFREKWGLEEHGADAGYFDSLRDRSPGRDVAL